MEPPPHDWIALWKICHPWFVWAYIGLGLPVRIMMARQHTGVWLNRIWPVSGAASALFVYCEFCMPLAAFPAFILFFLPGGNHSVHSLLMAFPIAVSVGAVGAMIDAVLFLMLRQAVNRKTLLMLFGSNALNALLAIGAVLLLIRLHPIQVIAVLGGWR